MKRTELLRHLRRHGCALLREGVRHSSWHNPEQNRHSSVPRHTENDEELSDKDAGESQGAVTVPERNGEVRLRPEVIVPTVTCDYAAALSVPAPGTVHLICVDPPYYNNVQYAELSNFLLCLAQTRPA